MINTIQNRPCFVTEYSDENQQRALLLWGVVGIALASIVALHLRGIVSWKVTSASLLIAAAPITLHYYNHVIHKVTHEGDLRKNWVQAYKANLVTTALGINQTMQKQEMMIDEGMIRQIGKVDILNYFQIDSLRLTDAARIVLHANNSQEIDETRLRQEPFADSIDEMIGDEDWSMLHKIHAVLTRAQRERFSRIQYHLMKQGLEFDHPNYGDIIQHAGNDYDFLIQHSALFFKEDREYYVLTLLKILSACDLDSRIPTVVQVFNNKEIERAVVERSLTSAKDRIPVVRFFVQRGFDFTPYFQRGSAEILTRLVLAGAKYEGFIEGYTVLARAVRQKAFPLLEAMVEKEWPVHGVHVEHGKKGIFTVVLETQNTAIFRLLAPAYLKGDPQGYDRLTGYAGGMSPEDRHGLNNFLRPLKLLSPR